MADRTPLKQYAFIPQDLRERMKATGISRRQVAAHMKQRNTQHFYQQLSGKTRMTEEMTAQLTELVQQLETGELVVSEDFPKVTPNLGGSFANVPDDYEPPLAPTPTEARAGSPEKVAIMIARGEAGYALMHPDDSKMHIAIGSSQRMAEILAIIDGEEYDEEDDDDA
jgi:hypothetical protein